METSFLRIFVGAALLCIATQVERGTEPELNTITGTSPLTLHFINEPPHQADFSNNTGIRIDCQVSNGHQSRTDRPTINWTFSDGTPVTNVPGLRQINSADGSLHFTAFSSEQFRQDVHAAVYRCAATSNDVGTIVSRDVKVRAVMDVEYDSSVYDIFAIRGNTAVVKCHVPAFLQDFVSVVAYIRDDSLKISSTEDPNAKYSLASNGALYIRDVGSNDAGSSYKCQTYHHLTRKMRISSSSGKLFVTDPHGNIPPRILDSMTKVEAKQGDNVLLPCVAHGYPYPKARWLLKEKSETLEIPKSVRIQNTFHGLHIKDTRLSDAGTYVCHLNNTVGTDQSELNLFISVPLQVKTNPVKSKVAIGGALAISCQVTGHPVTSVKWLKDGQPLNPTRAPVTSDNQLRVEVASIEDKGMYQCFAQNDKDSVQSAAEVELGEFPPMLIETFKETIIEPKVPVTFTCIAIGNPTPEIQWTLDTVLISQKSYQRLSVERTIANGRVISTMTIRTTLIEDGGVYTCSAINVQGKVDYSARLNIHGPLSARKVPGMNVIAGSLAFISCPIFGYPVDSLSWEKDSIKLPMNIRQRVLENGTLMMSNVQRREDTGEYKCVASNKHGQTAVGHIQISVLVLPKITPFTFQEELLREGMRARIQCVISEGDSPVVLKWMKDGNPISAELPGITVQAVDEYSIILAIRAVGPRHNGDYTCVARNAAGSARHTAKLFVNALPKIIPFAFQDDQNFKGMRAHITCAVSQGDLPLTFSWLKDGRPIETHSLGAQIGSYDRHSSSLSVDSVASKHSGNYTCVAANQAGQATFTAQLVVQVAPKVVPFSFQGDHMFEGVLARVSCVVYQGDLPITIQWSKDGQSLDHRPVEGVSIRSVDAYTSILTIDHVLSKHSGNYSCLAKNSASSVRHTAQLIVQGSSHNSPNEPVQNIKGIHVFENGTLVIEKVHEKHESVYFCVATNGIGSGLSRATELKVQAPVKIVQKSDAQTIRTGGRVTLKCFVQGDQPINTTWTINSKTLVTHSHSKYSRKQHENGTMVISELNVFKVDTSDAALYGCMAENRFGRDEATIEVTVQSLPDPPKDIKIVNKGERIVELTWKPTFDGHSPITNYYIEYKAKAGGLETYSSSAKTNAVVLDNLVPSVTYVFTVYSENDVGRSETGAKAEITLAGDAPSGPPESIRVQPQNGKSLRVSWMPPPKSTWNGNIRGYYVGYRKTEVEEPFEYKLLEVPEGYEKGLSFTLNDLEELTRYSIVVQAFNDHGKGSLSDQVLVMTSEGVPSKAPLSVHCSATSSQSVAVSWQPPPQTSINGILRGYKVLYWTSQYWNGETKLGIANATTAKVTLRGLSKYSNYSIQVLAHTLVGDGVTSKAIYCRTLEDVPDVPKDIKALASSASAILVTWSPPVHPNGVIMHYTVYMEDISSNNKGEVKHILQKNNDVYEVRNLKRNQNYRFRVSATTYVGEGPSTRTVEASPASMSSIPAQCAAFGEVHKLPASKPLILSCPTVGIPTPRRSWRFGGHLVSDSNRISVQPDGSLQITAVQQTDTGNYTCRVVNDAGHDEMTHLLIVKVSPSVAVLLVTSTTSTTASLHWKQPSDGNIPILGYALHFKQEFGTWQSLELQPYLNYFQLNNLQCGTSYQLYLVAHNEMGDGQPSEFVTVSTNGGVPSVPVLEKLLEESTKHVVLHLDSWTPNGCPILYYVVEYKARTSRSWSLVSKNLQPDKPDLILGDLQPGTWYNLRMAAHTSAGSSVAAYDFSTMDIGEDENISDDDDDRPLATESLLNVLHVKVLVPIAVCVVIVVLCVVATCLWVTRKRVTQNQTGVRPTTTNRNRKKRHSQQTGSMALAHEDSDDEISPYAMVKLSDFQQSVDSNERPSGSGNSKPFSTQNYNPTAPPMSESYSPGTMPPFTEHGRKYPVLGRPAMYATSKKDMLKGLRNAPDVTEHNQEILRPVNEDDDDETTFIFPPPPPPEDNRDAADYDPPPPDVLEWLAAKN